MKPDLELHAWREQWQAHTDVPADLRRKVERGSRNMRLMLASELLVTVTMGGGSAVWAVWEPRTEMYVLCGAIWFFLAAAWTFAIMSRRGAWSPLSMSAADFLDLSIRRCRGRLAASRFGAGLYFVEMVFCLIWLYYDPARRKPLPAIVFAVATPLFLAGLMRYRRKTRAELESLLQVQRDAETL